ncbi:MAG: hypothetical protein KPEEDBHJ_02916 [Anaerolineales bacterium]|nr:hypothetical protein [Anaerolineales bacterium]
MRIYIAAREVYRLAPARNDLRKRLNPCALRWRSK